MTIEEFQKIKVCAGMTAEYKGIKYDLMSVDWLENLVGIDEFGDGEISWKRCENITEIKLYD